MPRRYHVVHDGGGFRVIGDGVYVGAGEDELRAYGRGAVHKLREAMGAEMQTRKLNGHVEIDGAYFGGYVKPENRKEDRKDLRLRENQTGKRRVVVVMRERRGRTLPFVFESEDEAVPTIQARVMPGSTVYADEAPCWDALHARFEAKRVSHSIMFQDEGKADTNQAESYFSRLRRAEIGTHHHISGPYLRSYANEMAWREDYRREPNGTQYLMVAAAATACSIQGRSCPHRARYAQGFKAPVLDARVDDARHGGTRDEHGRQAVG